MNDRFHKAAKDGNLDILKTGRKTDLNQPDADGMTPTLYAAYHGNLPALTLCCSRGGDPNKFDYTGNSALHLCVQKSRMECVFFLVEFGANIWQQDNDFHSPLDRAIINGDKDCERYLDGIVGKQKRENPKKVKKLQTKARETALKNIEKYKKLQADWDRKMSREFNGRKISATSMPDPHPGRMTSQTLSQPPTKKSSGFFSTFSKKKTIPDSGFKISVNERKVSQTLDGFQSEQVASVMYRQPEEMMRYESAAPMTRRAPIDGVFPPEEQTERDIGQLFGTINLRQNTTSARSMLSMLPMPGSEPSQPTNDEITPPVDRPSYLLDAEEDVELSDASDSEEDSEVVKVEKFLSSLKLQSLLPMFLDEDMDMETLQLCDHESLKEIGVTFGPRIKILNALKERKEREIDQSELTLF